MSSLRTDLNPDQVVLVESVRARMSVAPISLGGVILPILLFVPVLLSLGVSLMNIAQWVVPVLMSMMLRAWYSRRVARVIDTMDAGELSTADRWLRISSLLNQFLVGLGIWIIQSPISDSLVLPLFVTLIQMVFLLGVMTNLFSDFLTFSFSAPLLLGQTILFWLFQGPTGIAIGASMSSALVLMYMLQKRASRIFGDSVLMQFEKENLLAALGTEKARAENALKETQRANESKAFFMAAASHDIKQPLFALGMLTDTLLMSEQSEQTSVILNKQRRNINKMNFMFDDLMDLSRFEQGVYKLNVADVTTADLAQTLEDEFFPQCQEKNLNWVLSIEIVRIRTDPMLLLRLCRNLLNNALRYTDTGEVKCEARAVGEHFEFVISDTGTGIALEDQPRVFKQFVRLQEGTSDGAGLGLTIVDYIVQALEYDLVMASEPGCGTSFQFNIPLSLPAEAQN